jgi:hypothetical protein
MTSLPSPSHLPPMKKNVLPMEDGKKVKSAWGLIVWAYADELAAAASAAAPGAPISKMAGPGVAQTNWSGEYIGGLINGWYEPPADARLIDEKLRAWFSHDREGLQRVISYAEKRTEIPPAISLERWHEVPRLDHNGKPRFIYTDKKGRAVFPPYGSNGVRYLTKVPLTERVGIDPVLADAKEAAYREFYALFLAFLDAMPGFPFIRWKCVERGLTNNNESLTR